MAKGQDHSRFQKGVIKRYYEHRDTMALQNLGQIGSDLFLCEDPKKAARLWDRAAKALKHTDADVDQVEKILSQRDVAGLCQLVNELSAPGRRSSPPESSPGASSANTAANPGSSSRSSQPAPARSSLPGPTPPPDAADKEVLKRAMKAFRKRLKLTRLDEESKLGVGPLSGGKRSSVVAINPPNQYPSAVWEALVDQGKLKRAGTGFYALAQE